MSLLYVKSRFRLCPEIRFVVLAETAETVNVAIAPALISIKTAASRITYLFLKSARIFGNFTAIDPRLPICL